MTIKVGSANITDTVASILTIWQDDNFSQLRTHIETINSIQDFLCRILNNTSSEEKTTIGELLGEIVCVKDDLKLFIDKTGDELI